MGNSQLVYSFLLVFITFSSSSSSMNTNHKCPDKQRDALLLLKQNISSIKSSYVYIHDIHEYCDGLLGHSSYDYSIELNWNRSADCCDWVGITCNNFTGDVISLNLTCGKLQGIFELDLLLSNLPKLEVVDLSYSGLAIRTRNKGHYVNPYFCYLRLASCKLTAFPDFLRTMKNLQILDLSMNEISGHIPAWVGEIGGNNLTYLDLSDNSITGLPEFKSDGLQYLYLKSNQIQGPFPPWIYNKKHLKYLDISNNSITGPFPTTICNMSSLLSLDMSSNSFHGELPECFGNITSSFAMINLGENKFHGTIPEVYGYCGLVDGLLLNGNKFEGEVPRSLCKCQSLKVLDLGNNHLNGTFPRCLGDLPMLKVLILGSNNLHGTLEASSISVFPFSSLQVFDISNNGFVGRLPGKYFETFNAIKDVEKGPKTKFYISGLPSYSINVRVNYLQLFFSQSRIEILFTAIDISSNRLEGEIPNVIGNLKSLMLLNLSNNNLSGQIPRVLGNIYDMEVLDLSRNQLVGEIPQSLAKLSFLSFLNLSRNHLMGRIPIGPQLQTFSEDSFYGNPGLCGTPLANDCEDLSSNKGEWIYMEPAMLGLGCGTLLGVVLGYRMLSTGKPKWINAIVDARGHTRIKKKRKHVHIRKRR